MLNRPMVGRRRRRRVTRPRRLAALFLCLFAVIVEGLLPARTVARNPEFAMAGQIVLHPLAPTFTIQSGTAALGVAGGPLLFHQGLNALRPIASTTKIMTAYLILKSPGYNPGKVVHIPNWAVQNYQRGISKGDSEVPLKSGETATMGALMDALMLPSADDAAWVLAGINGSPTAFVAKMNATAKALGMTHTHYADPDGVSTQTESTVGDLLKLVAKVMQIPAFRQLVSTSQITVAPFGHLTNLNQLLTTYPGMLGIKTGSTLAAGTCLVFAAERSPASGAPPVTLYGAVLGEQSFDRLFHDVAGLLNSGFTLRRTTVLRAGQVVAQLPLSNGQQLPIVVRHSVAVWATRGSVHVIPQWISLKGKPLQAGTPVGELDIEEAGWPTIQEPMVLAQGHQDSWWAHLKW